VTGAPPHVAPHAGLDPRARRFLDLVAAAAKPRDGAPKLEDLRAATNGLAAFAAPPPPVERRDETLAGGRVAVRLYAPPGSGDAPAPALVYFHGGGWISGGIASHDAICATLAARGLCRVIAIDYRLAPEHRFPAALDDGRAALEAIAAQPRRYGVDPKRLGIAGDSAGANLAVVVAREASAPLALQLLLCPVMDPLGRTPSRAALAAGWLIEEATMAAYWDCFRVPDLSPDDPRVAPLRCGDLASQPPALVHVAEFDPLRDEGEAYAAALTQTGVRAELTVHAGLIHHFYGLGGVVPAAQAAFERVCRGLKLAWAASA
jgi:acetyl esterase/lipase